MKKIAVIFSIFITLLLAGLIEPISIQPANASNIVVNGTFDNNTTGWMGTYSLQSGPAGDFPTLDSQSYFWAGNNAQNVITQTYNLSPTDLQTLGSTGLDYMMSADLFGYASQSDNAIFTAKFFAGKDGTGTLLDSVALSAATNDPGTWSAAVTAGNTPNFQSKSANLPISTQSIVFELTANRGQGSSNDGYADNLAFDLNTSSTTTATRLENNTELVINGAFDNNTTGWTGTYALQSGPAGGFPTVDSQSYFWGGNNAKTVITQTYNLSPTDLKTLSSLGLDYTISADLFGYASQGDNAVFTAKFFDGKGGTGTLLSSVALSSTTNDPGTWSAAVTAGNTPNFQSKSDNLPISTQSIVFELTANRAQGSSNDGYADNLSFEINSASFTEIINIDSTKNLSSKEGVKITLPAASYTVRIIGTKDGGTYDAWTKNSRVEGCDENGKKCKKGWEHKYFYKLGDAKKVKVKQTGRYATPEQALENPPADITFTLTEETEVNFFVKDPKNPANNQGGVSLEIVGK